ncbi:hypothetical protein LIER_40670 [Lithospermum erythrorhizon]|uniref:Uncharacterized protein n=1 Tax=Lithospermum erythrorhizon TaxID=34254 RepID=A0AAV3R0F6_LITER
MISNEGEGSEEVDVCGSPVEYYILRIGICTSEPQKTSDWKKCIMWGLKSASCGVRVSKTLSDLWIIDSQFPKFILAFLRCRDRMHR